LHAVAASAPPPVAVAPASDPNRPPLPPPAVPCTCATQAGSSHRPGAASPPPLPARTGAAAATGQDLDFGLYFFANYDHAVVSNKYRLLLDAVRFADAHGFASVFTPERHFEDFGGLYPNPAVVSAALAATTRQIQIRAGSIVSPLHDPLCLAEDWAVVDNLSDGRAGVAFTYGWQCDDFVLAPDRYLDRHAQMFAQIATVRKLWRGEAVERENGLGRKVSIRTYPRPIQKEIPIWVTCAISRDSFVNAGRIGANVVTFLLGQGLGDLQEKIAAYRAALADSGFDPEQGRVSLMVHTYLGENVESVKRTVREPFLHFIRAQTQLARNLVRSVDPSSDISDPKIINALMDIGFERFFGESGLMGTVATCRESAKRFRAMGVDELSCLVDFGLDYDAVMASLRRLTELKDSFAPSRKPRSLFPDHRARGGTVPVAFTPIAPPPAAPTASAPERNGAGGDSFGARLDTFRSYLPGGNCVPGTPSLLPAPSGPAARNGGTAHPYPVSGGNGHAAPASPPPAPPESLHEPFPLTAVQQAYWMGRNPQLELGATSTHGYVELRVALDLPRFQAALQRVIDRHPMLRAVVPSGREQRVLPGRLEYRMEIVDLSGLGAAEQERRLRAERERQSHRVFDPATWPLFDFKAFILRPGQQYLLFGFDSLIADASSLTLIFREIMELHDHPGRELAPIGFTFRDYLHGYGEFRKSAAYLRDRAFWLERIPSLPPAPDVPLRKLPAEVSQPRFLRLDATIEQAVWQEAKAAAKRHLVTPTVLLFTAFAQVLAEVGSRQSFSLNLTVFNRLPLHPDVNRIVGDFTALMLVAAEYRPEMTFWKNAATLQGAVLQALGHRYFDGVEVIKELARQRNLLGRAVIPVVFTSNLLNTENGEDGLSAMGEVAYMITQTTQAYLDNQVAENRQGLYIAWDYVAELFEPAVINGMFQRYVRIVAELGGATPPPLALPPVPPQSELSPLEAFVARYNATDDPSIVSTTLAALFHAQVERTPEGAAVRFGSEVLTYRDLDRRSNQVAHYLHARGVGRGDLVGLITPRSIATIVNTLGIVKSGAAYVPVDPEYPESRQRYILEKAGAAVVLTPALTAEICRDNPATPFPCPSRPEDLAYIIFTSGSTGQPKGVMITHAAVTNTLVDLNRRFAVGPADRVLGLSSMCFDLSVYDVFGTLAAGACLVLIDDIRNPEHLVRTVRDQRITLWNSVPTLFRMMVDAATGANPAPDLRLALLSGDWIPITLPTDARRRFPTAEIYSLGGATEASIWSILFPIPEVEPHWTSIPYGLPLANQRFYVLDDDLAFCPVGTPGQLFIGGVGLSSGYFKDPEKTAAAYFTHPRLGRLYRTGDWGVWRESGYIEFLGRRDHQVKIRGFRVELGEIEARLLKHPGIKQAVVLDRTDARGNRSLCAYLVPRLAPTPSA
jgi:natural product biosynthesis luciferase-like monooxygenase protein/amino acid adenylation domain-containing protein